MALAARIPAQFGLAPNIGYRAALAAVLACDAKAPGALFRPDSAAKRAAAAGFGAAAAAIAGPVVAALEAVRAG